MTDPPDDEAANSNNNNNNTAISSAIHVIPSFEEAFAPLAHYLFPDGCPNDNNNTNWTSSVWPTRRSSRKVVSATQAKASILKLKQVARRVGFTSNQLEALVVACAAATARSQDGGTVVQDLIQCLIPTKHHMIPAGVARKLLWTVSTTTTIDDNNNSGLAKSMVFQFLTLALRHGYLRDEILALYSIVFHMVVSNNNINTSKHNPTLDGVRLLHLMTRKRHVQVHRAKQLRHLYNQWSSVDNNNNVNTTATATTQHNPSQQQQETASLLFMLLQLYAQYNFHGCGPFIPKWTRKQQRALSSKKNLLFGNTTWEREFTGEFFIARKQDKSSQEHETTTIAAATNKHDENGSGVHENSQGSIMTMRPWKRPRLSSSSKTTTSWEWLLEHNDAHSFTTLEQQTTTMTTNDSSLHHLLLLLQEQRSNKSDAEMVRVRACLPYMLHQEWYHHHDDDEGRNRDEVPSQRDTSKDKGSQQQQDDHSSQQQQQHDEMHNSNNNRLSRQHVSYNRHRVLEALASMARHHADDDVFLPEVESFLLQDILPQWDGHDDDDDESILLFHDLLGVLSPCYPTFSEFQSKVLVYVSPLVLYASSPRIQYSIVAGGLSSLLRRWGRLDWSLTNKKKSGEKIEQQQQRKNRTLLELIQWTEPLLLTAFVVSENGHELLRLATLTFFEVVVEQQNLFVTPLLCPSLVYQLLTSPSALCVDRTCRLLVRYKNVFSTFKRRQQNDGAALDRNIALLNCYIWDFCSVLWRCSPLPSSNNNNDSMARTKSILFTDLPPDTLQMLHQDDDNKASSSLSITHGAAFCGYACDFLKEQQYHASSSPDVICGKVKLQYLDYLKNSIGMEGLYTFLTTFVGSLADRQQRREETAAAASSNLTN